MDSTKLEVGSLMAELREQLRVRPYLTLAGAVGTGLVLGRRLPLRALLAIGGLGIRAAAASALEGAVRRGIRPS